MQLIEEKMNFAAPKDVVMSVITDYARYPEFLPEIYQVIEVSRDGATAVVEFQIEVLMKIAYELRITESRPDSISWVLEDSKVLTVNDGSWTLTEKDDGTTDVVYGLRLELKGRIPTSVSDQLTGKALPETLERFRARAESLARAEEMAEQSN